MTLGTVYVYRCERGHVTESKSPDLMTCPAYVRGAPCPGRLTVTTRKR